LIKKRNFRKFAENQFDMSRNQRFCLECGEPLAGRSDKKFCSDYCRNAYNNRKNRETNKLIREINSLLKRNYKILEEVLNDRHMTKIHRSALTRLGFQFDYITRKSTTKKGDTYYYIYDLGYLPLANDMYLIVKKDA